jgi:predicted PurR-regulated permease PerM
MTAPAFNWPFDHALPAENHARARPVWRAIEAGVGAYGRGEVVQALLAGTVLALG